MGTRPGLKGFAVGVTPTARHPLNDLYGLAVLILGYVADVDVALIAAVGPQALEAGVVGVQSVVGEHFGYFGAYT
jgi:hypothetical protein